MRMSWKQIYYQINEYLQKASGTFKKDNSYAESGLILADSLNTIGNIALYRFPIFLMERMKQTHEAHNKIPASQLTEEQKQWENDFKELDSKLNSKKDSEVQSALLGVHEFFKQYHDFLTKTLVARGAKRAEVPGSPEGSNPSQANEAAVAVSTLGYYKIREDAELQTKQLTNVDVEQFLSRGKNSLSTNANDAFRKVVALANKPAPKTSKLFKVVAIIVGIVIIIFIIAIINSSSQNTSTTNYNSSVSLPPPTAANNYNFNCYVIRPDGGKDYYTPDQAPANAICP
jgi:hypothetical protein